MYTPPPDGSYFPIHKITEPEALTRSIAVHMYMYMYMYMLYMYMYEDGKDGKRRVHTSADLRYHNDLVMVCTVSPADFRVGVEATRLAP